MRGAALDGQASRDFPTAIRDFKGIVSRDGHEPNVSITLNHLIIFASSTSEFFYLTVYEICYIAY